MNENNIFVWEESSKGELELNQDSNNLSSNSSFNIDIPLNSIDWLFCIENNDKQTIHNYLLKKTKSGRNIPLLQKEIINVIEKEEFNYDLFWNFVYILLTFNSKMFLSTLVKYIKENRVKIPQCEEQLLEDILFICFRGTEKIQHSFDLIKYSKVELNYSQTKKILDVCLLSKKTKTIENFFDYFNTPISIKINLLRDNIHNESAVYLLYKSYVEAKKRKLINENTIVEVYSYPYITSLINDLKNLSEIHIFYSKLLEYEILGKKNDISYLLRNNIKIEGGSNIEKYLIKKKNESKVKKELENIKYNELSRFNFIRELDNHFYFTSKDYSIGALMMKSLAYKNKFIYKEGVSAFIYKYSKSHSMLFIYQKLMYEFKEPPLINNGSTIIVSFNKNMQVRIRNYADIIKLRITNIEFVRDYKKKYVAKIINKVSLFRYNAELIDVLE